PQTGLVYIPAMVMPGGYSNPADYKFIPGAWNVGQGGFGATPAGAADKPFLPPTGVEFGGRLVAWDPIAQKARWSVKQAGPWNSGLLATAGGLVFGGAGKDFKAWSAATGDEIWSYPTGAGIIAAPMTYSLDGRQYLALMVGQGGAGGMGVDPRGKGRLLVFELGGTGKLAPYPDIPPQPPLDLTNAVASAADPKQGMALYGQFCGACHAGGGYLPNLRATPLILEPTAWKAVVHDGALKQNGMAGFARFMTEGQAESIRAYLLDQARSAARR
ncbi:MAG: c-type cytochrome, partial [Phenylobacterium sp.]